MREVTNLRKFECRAINFGREVIKVRVTNLTVLSDKEIRKVHEASLKILSETGINIQSEKVLELLEEHGAEINREKNIAKIPSSLVNELLQAVPSKIKLYNRNKAQALTLGKREGYAISGHNAPFVLDSDSGERREATKGDAGNFARLADALENIDLVAPQVMPQEVKPEASLLHAVEATFTNTEKHIYFSPEKVKETKAMLEMAKAVSGEESLSLSPIVTCQLSPTAPLSWEKGPSESIIEVAREGVPLCILPMACPGLSAPYTLAGTLALHNAELLSGIVISQLTKRGSPVIYGGAWATFDMRESSVSENSPETCVLRIAGAQMASFYNLPYHSVGPESDAHLLDEQNAWERALTTYVCLNTGVDFLADVGMFESALTVSLEQLVIDDEILGYIRRVLRGIEVSPETLAVEVIQKVGPRNNFLTEDHTLRYLRTDEHWQPNLTCRIPREKWAKKGKRSIVEQAKERVQDILISHKVPPLDDGIRAELARIVKEYEEHQTTD